VLLIADSAYTGVHGEEELQAFQTLKPAYGSLRDMVFNHMMPALQRADLLAFGAYMAELQAYNGEYFAPVQGGHYASKDVEIVLNWLKQNGVACVGQSSWGPTGFAIVESAQQAETLQSQAQLAFAGKPNISFQICRGKNTGALIKLG
jgi:predicted sugar kinase